MSKTWIIILSILVALLLCSLINACMTPEGRALWNTHWYEVQKADDRTNYETLKQVEDTCRAMISSYNTDKLTYEQYRDSDNEEKQSWAEQAKMRANKTAISYNEYILKNSFIWEDNIPNDIDVKLDTLE